MYSTAEIAGSSGSENDVQLPDEYDQINRDLRVFRALSPRDLQARILAASELPDTYTLKVRHGSLRTSSSFDGEAIAGADERLAGQVELIRPISRYLDDLTVVYSIHDTPTCLLGWDHREELLEHVEEDECMSFAARTFGDFADELRVWGR